MQAPGEDDILPITRHVNTTSTTYILYFICLYAPNYLKVCVREPSKHKYSTVAFVNNGAGDGYGAVGLGDITFFNHFGASFGWTLCTKFREPISTM